MGAQATVATLGPLPAGNYLVIGTTQVRNTIHDVEWGCHVAGPAGQFLGGGITFTEANINPPGSETTITMAGIARLLTPGTVTIQCSNLTTTGGSETLSRMFAVKVGQPR
jgi:hypothetical protein